MTDTQWPKYAVFHQEREDRPHIFAGNVHAPDPELALMNARDVFVRRPTCVSLWVARADVVFSRTAQELEGWTLEEGEGEVAARYLVFQKKKHFGAPEHVGEVKARSVQAALAAALEAFEDSSVLLWWVLPAEAVHATDFAEAESLFTPAERKEYRNPGFFHTLTAKRKYLRDEEQEADDGS